MPHYDIQKIKSQLCILDLFNRDGHTLKKTGSNYFCLCPFHEEKTPSCCVYENTNSYHCYGCNTGGDTIAYWQRSRDCSFLTALAQLATITGINQQPSNYPPVAVAPPPTSQKKAITSLTNKELNSWAKACELLLVSPQQIERIARWRGFSEELVHWAAKRQLLGLLSYAGELRESFIVKAPTDSSNHLISTSFHIRLAPNSTCNTTDKASWRFTPKGQKSWPFIIGSPHTTKFVFITEGQWDALALCEIMHWHTTDNIFDSVCILGMRGATATSKKLIESYTINPKATALIFADSDKAGNEWLHSGGLIESFKDKVSAFYGFKPDIPNSDLNDRLKSGFTQDQLMMATPNRQSQNNINNPTLKSILNHNL